MGEKTYLSLASIGEDAEELGVFFFFPLSLQVLEAHQSVIYPIERIDLLLFFLKHVFKSVCVSLF